MRHLQPLVASDRRPLGLLVPSGLGSSVGLGKEHFLFRLRFFFSPAMCPSIRILAVPHLTQRCQSVLPRFCAPLSFIPPQSLSAYAPSIRLFWMICPYLTPLPSLPYAMNSSCQLLDLANTVVNTTQKRNEILKQSFLLSSQSFTARRVKMIVSILHFFFWVVLTAVFAKSSSWQEEFMT